MNDTTKTWWAVHRGWHRIAIETQAQPRILQCNEARWTPDDPEFLGAVSGVPKPIGIVDAAQRAQLPASPLPGECWVLASGDATEQWAVASDAEPYRLAEVEQTAVQWLPSAQTRDEVATEIMSNGEKYIVVPTTVLSGDAAGRIGAVLSERRIATRVARLDAKVEQSYTQPELLVTRSSDIRWGLEADAVSMIVRVEHITPLPGAMPMVWGLSAITGRVTMILDPSRELCDERSILPCWVAQIRSADKNWGVASGDVWEGMTPDQIEVVDDHTARPGVAGLVVRCVESEVGMVNVLSLEKLAELAGGKIGDAE
jgi:chemotaxis signal transduction protein